MTNKETSKELLSAIQKIVSETKGQCLNEELITELEMITKPISEFYDLLKGGEFKLKQGFLDFWIPVFLILKKEDYSLYSSEGEYIPHLTPDIMDLIHKNPNRFQIKRLITEGVNLEFFHSYKELVGYNESNIKGLESSYITIYSNFLRFYRGLEEYSKNTKQLSPEAVGVRDAISKAKDPETHNNIESFESKNLITDL